MNANLPECIEAITAEPASRSVIWLHGLGADGHDFEPLVPELRLPAEPGIRFVFPHAPHRPVTMNGGMNMRAWYDITSLDIADGEDEQGILESADMVERLIARENERGIETRHIVLAGFSQGGAIALHTGLRHGQRLGGIVALSAYLPLGDRLPGELSEANHDTPIFQAHGRQDPVIPIEGAQRSRGRITELRPAPAWHEYDMPHAVCPQEITDLRAWLLRSLVLDDMPSSQNPLTR